MKKISILLSLLITFGCCTVAGQPLFRCMAPDKPVVLHEPFRIQYIIDDAIAENEFIAPDWTGFGFTLVTDKQVNKGFFQTQKGKTAIKNIVYTLLANTTGIKLIQPATITTGKKMYKCNAITINVVAAGSVNVPVPIQKNINNKLYLKLQVTKNNCYVGEPVMATYKLYSAVSTQTEISKNPAFIGFSAFNALPAQIKPADYVTANGIAYEVHTLAKSLLFPLQDGNYTVDKMEVHSKVYPENAIPGLVAADSFEVSSASNTASVQVKALPAVEDNEHYYGGVGSFKLSADWTKDRLKRNETGNLIVRLEGTGNFTQITAPEFQWPQGLNVFSAEIKDSVSVTDSGMLSGTRYFIFPFNSGKSGHFIPDTVLFTYFDLAQKKYITLKTRPGIVKVSNEKYIGEPKKNKNTTIMQGAAWRKWLLAGILAFAAAVIIGLLVLRKRNSVKKREEKKQAQDLANTIPGPGVCALLPLEIHLQGKEFFIHLKKQVLQVVAEKIQAPVSKINTLQQLKNILEQRNTNAHIIAAITGTVNTCNEKIYAPDNNNQEDTEPILVQANNALDELWKDGRK